MAKPVSCKVCRRPMFHVYKPDFEKVVAKWRTGELKPSLFRCHYCGTLMRRKLPGTKADDREEWAIPEFIKTFNIYEHLQKI